MPDWTRHTFRLSIWIAAVGFILILPNLITQQPTANAAKAVEEQPSTQKLILCFTIPKIQLIIT